MTVWFGGLALLLVCVLPRTAAIPTGEATALLPAYSRLAATAVAGSWRLRVAVRTSDVDSTTVMVPLAGAVSLTRATLASGDFALTLVICRS